jgi:hypothetical protein
MNYSDLHELEGLQFIPVNEAKEPQVKNWQTSTDKHNLNNCWGVGLVCGVPSGNVECIDVDLKYDLTGNLFDNYKRSVHEVHPTLLNKLVVQRTKSGGYHLIYRCSKIEGNIKLANRRTTEEERKDTYEKTYSAEILKDGVDEELARKRAQKSSENDKVRVLFETRGLGGQFVCSPTPGYEFVFGDIISISEITPDERDILHGIARQFNEFYEEPVFVNKPTFKSKGKSPFDDYNENGDVVALLQEHGWRVVGQKGQKTIFLRPGQTTSQSSGNFDHGKNWFSVFTTSTEFDPQKAYLPYAVFAVLECNKDFSVAAKRLVEMGYGEKGEDKKPTESTRIIKSRVNPDDDDYSFLAKPEDYDGYLQQVIDGTLPQGLTTGSPMLDKNFLFKVGDLVMTNGIDNTGKSVVTWWLMLLAALYHGWGAVVFSSENTLGAFMRKMIQFYWGKPLHGRFAMNESEYTIAKKFIEKHFKLIKAQEDLYNYKDIINMVKKTRKRQEYLAKLENGNNAPLMWGLIDPYNSLKIDLSGFSKLNTHEYHYEALSEIKAYGQQTGFGWVLNNHAVTSALRQKDGEKKYPVAPRKEDTEGGGKFANKADDFITIHRLTQHPTDWMITELHIRKIKDTETGGQPSPLDSPLKFEMYKGGTAFKEHPEDGTHGIDPIAEWHKKNTKDYENKLWIQEAVYGNPNQPKGPPIRNTWTPYVDDDDEEPF